MLLHRLRFEIRSAEHIASSPQLLPDRPGAYMLLAAPECNPLRAFAEASADPTPNFAGYDALYVGATGDDLRYRVRQHLRDDSRGSTLRMTLGLVLLKDLGLSLRPICGKRYFCFDNEQVLSAWLVANTLIAFRVGDRPFDVEVGLLAIGAGFANVAGRKSTLSRRLRALRATANGRRISRSDSPKERTSENSGEMSPNRNSPIR